MLKIREFNYHKKGIVIFLLTLFSLSILQAQQNIPLENQNKVKLIQFAKGRSAEWMSNKRKADSLAQTLNIPTFYFEKDSNRVVILQRMGQKNKPVYYATDNISAAATISVDDVWASNNEFPSLTGKGVEINLWDGGSVRATHQELQNGSGSRIIMRDLELPLSNHSTHIAGTMIATGVNADAKGMAGAAIIKAWDLNDDIAEMSSAAADGIVLSNHSYGPLCGWSYNSNNESWYWYGDPEISATEDYEFGFYNQVSADWDYIAELAPYYLIIKSAGNDRNDAPDSSFMHYVWDETWKLVDVEREPDGGMDGYDCLTPMAVAKNILTVGAVDDAKTMTPFSAFGPTDDGRIKPDVVANGYDVLSSTSAKDNSYTSYSGTSMSTASVSGSVALLHQLKNILQPGVQWLSSTIKALLIHTASDLGNTGPDYRFGWGLVNIKNACDLIYANSNNQGKNIYQEVLTQGEEIIIPISTSNSFPVLKITLVWTDPAGQPSTPSLNSRNSKLVNDLNVLVQNSSTLEEFLPWTLNVESPGTAATKNINHVDNVEQVYIANPGTNNFIIKISHSGTLSGGSQSFSLIVSGIETTPNIFPPQNLTYTINESSIGLNWNPPVSGTPGSYKIYRNGTLLKETTDLFFTDESVVFDNIYQYYVTATYNINNEKIESLPTNEITVFPKTLRSLPFVVDFESEPSEITIGNNPLKWRWGDSESLNCYYLNFSDNTTKFIGIDSYSAGDVLHVSDIAYTSPLRLADYNNIILSFDYLLKTGIYDAIDELHVVYKLQDENEWHELKKLESAFEWVHHTFELPQEMCKNGTQIGFYYDDFYQWGMGAGLDNVKIVGETSARNIDLAILSMNSPVSSCLLSENETASIAIKNVGENPALPGDSITIQMNCSTGESFTNILVLTETLNTNDIITFEIGSVDLSKAGKYTFEFEISCSLDTNLANNELAKEIEVLEAPQPAILNQDLEFCADEPTVFIEVSPTGGTLSGDGIDGFFFDPQVAGVGSHFITYSITNLNGCEGTVSKEFVVNALPQPVFLDDELSFCETDDRFLVQVSPSGGILSGAGIDGMYFDPAMAGAGIHTISYSVTDNSECTGTVTKKIEVFEIPKPAILNQDLEFCADESRILIEVSPAGGTLSGQGIDGFYFDPKIAGVGSHSITYSVTNINGCEGTVSKEFVVSKNPQPEILNQDLVFSEEEQRVLIEVTSLGGELSGPGIDGMYFDPQVAGVGSHTIIYSYVDENNCIGITSVEIVVNRLTQAAILNSDLSFCENDPKVFVEVYPSGGELSGAGIDGSYFDPQLAGIGTHRITYSIIDDYGNTETVTAEFVVNALPQAVFLNEELNFCEYDDRFLLEVSPLGGVLSGTGIDGSYFDPSISGAGIHEITYSVTDKSGCTGTATKEIVVFEIPQPAILNQDLEFCAEESRILIEVSPSGGTLSGPGIDGSYFDPQIAGVGNHKITYLYTNENGCEETTSVEIVILEKTIIDLGPDLDIGINDTISIVPETLGCTLLWCDGSSDQEYMVIAKDLGIGVHLIWVEASSLESCNVVDSILIRISATNAIEKSRIYTQAFVYPNPFRNGFYLKLGDDEWIKTIYLYNLDGLLILNKIPSTFPYFDTSQIAAGAYLLIIQTNKQHAILQIVKP